MSYYLTKGFVILEEASLALENVPLRFEKCIHAINMFNSDSIISYSTSIPSFENTVKKIYPGGNILDEFTSIYYEDKNDTFGMLFQNYTGSSGENVYHPVIFK